MVQTVEVCSPGERRRRRTTLHRLLQRTTRMRQSDLDRYQSFSWLHCAISIVSYLLMLSDVLRTGLGVSGLGAQYGFHEPDQLVFFGPYAYPVMPELFLNQTTDIKARVRYWPYKYDTTSVVMRAIAELAAIDAWPPCVMYQATCEEVSGLPLSSVFSMLDAVVEAVKDYKSIHHHQRGGHVSLRMDYAYFDRVHHYAFPWFFFRPRRRTGQAIYYELKNLDTRALCGVSVPRAYACGEAWTNFQRFCGREQNELCGAFQTLWPHIISRVRTLRLKYPMHTLDLTLVEGMDDYMRQGLTLQGVKFYDIVTIIRIRQCDALTDTCTTIAVDDYRYEAATLAVNAPNWYGVSALIRGFGQLYAWVRLVALFVGCYVARSSETRMLDSGLCYRLRTTVRTVFLVPSQVMIYGSLVPIVCYVAAHLIDAAAVYELMGQQFISLMGVISLDFEELLRVCAVSMRSVWVLAFACHALHWVSAQCVWSPLHGVLGVPEFVLSFVASLTVLAQLRFISFRDSRVWEVEETLPSQIRHQWYSAHFASAHGFLYRLFFGTEIDYKCLAASIILHVGLVVVIRMGNRLCPAIFKYQLLLLTRTVVPFGAGQLWRSGAIVVSWHGTFLKPTSKTVERSIQPNTTSKSSVPSTRLLMHAVMFPRIGEAGKLPHHVKVQNATTMPILDNESSRFIEQDMHAVEKRTREIESSIYLMNLGVMTDPLTYLQLRVFGGRLIGVYETKVTKRCVMLPFKLTTSMADIPIDWDALELQFVMNTKDLDWWDLLQCG